MMNKEILTQLEQSKQAFEKWKAELEAQTKIAVAEIGAKTTLQSAQLSAAAAGADVQVDGQIGPVANAAEKLNQSVETMTQAQQAMAQKQVDIEKANTDMLQPLMQMHGQMMNAHGQTMQAINGLTQHLKTKKTKIVRDAEGRIAGIE